MSSVYKRQLPDTSRSSRVKRPKLSASDSLSASSPVTPSPCTTAGSSSRSHLTVSSDITLDMLRPHFEKPLAKVAATFGICVTLLKKICRRHGIARWPHRQITGLRKSIASMEHAIYYFDGARRESYVEQLAKQKVKLAALLADPTTKNNAILATTKDTQVDKGSKGLAIAYAAQEAAADAFAKRTCTLKGQGASSPTGPFVGTSPYYGIASGVTPLQALPIWLPSIESSCSGQCPKAYSPSMVDQLHCEDGGDRTPNSYYNYVFDSATLSGRLPPIQSGSRGMLPPISSLVGKPSNWYTFTM